MLDCRECKPKYANCAGKEYYEPRDIKFCSWQILFLIEHIKLIKDLGGEYWPQNPDEVSDIKRKGIARNAKFETPSLIKAETEIRLKETGADGEILEAQIEAGRLFYELSKRAKDALFYMSGRRKRLKYSQWKANRTYKEGK